MSRLFLVITFSLSLFIFFPSIAFSLSAVEVVESCAEKDNALESIDYIRSVISQVKIPKERRSLFAFLGSLQEQLGLYSDACSSYLNAASIAAGDADGMQKVSSEQLILNAIRSSLSAGDYESAEIYLSSSIRDSKSGGIQAYIKLYEQWCELCKAQSVADIKKPVEILKGYLSIPALEIIKPSLYLTLWYVTGQDTYALELRKKYPETPEASIVTGSAYLLPVPFWYFIPKDGVAHIVPGYDHPSVSGEKKSKKDITVIEQVGLFRKWDNASNLVASLAAKGFNAYIKNDVRSNGCTYYLVLVDDDSSYSIGKKLKAAGFDCYPIK